MVSRPASQHWAEPVEIEFNVTSMWTASPMGKPFELEKVHTEELHDVLAEEHDELSEEMQAQGILGYTLLVVTIAAIISGAVWMITQKKTFSRLRGLVDSITQENKIEEPGPPGQPPIRHLGSNLGLQELSEGMGTRCPVQERVSPPLSGVNTVRRPSVSSRQSATC